MSTAGALGEDPMSGRARVEEVSLSRADVFRATGSTSVNNQFSKDLEQSQSHFLMSLSVNPKVHLLHA